MSKEQIGAEGREEHFMVEVHLCRCPRAAKPEECGMHFNARAVKGL